MKENWKNLLIVDLFICLNLLSIIYISAAFLVIKHKAFVLMKYMI